MCWSFLHWQRNYNGRGLLTFSTTYVAITMTRINMVDELHTKLSNWNNTMCFHELTKDSNGLKSNILYSLHFLFSPTVQPDEQLVLWLLQLRLRTSCKQLFEVWWCVQFPSFARLLQGYRRQDSMANICKVDLKGYHDEDKTKQSQNFIEVLRCSNSKM